MAQPLLRVPGFAIYLIARFLVGLTLRALVLSVSFHVYELTNDPIALGYVGLAMFLPVVGFGLVAGDLLDRLNRATVLIASSVLGGACAIGLLFVALDGTTAIWPFYVLISLFGISFTFARPAMPSLVPQLVGSAQLTRGIAMASSTSQMATVLGPPIAGALLIAGPELAYAVTAMFSFVAAVFWFVLKPYASDVPAQTGQSMRSRIAEGLRIVFRTPLILGCMSLDLFAMLLGSVVALLPIFARDILMVGPFGLGLLRAAPAVGATLMAIVLSRFAAPRPAGPIMLGSVACFGVAMVVFGLSRSLALSLVALAISGGFDPTSIPGGQEFDIVLEFIAKVSGQPVEGPFGTWTANGVVGPSFSQSLYTYVNIWAWWHSPDATNVHPSLRSPGAAIQAWTVLSETEPPPLFGADYWLGSVWLYRNATVPEPQSALMMLIILVMVSQRVAIRRINER